MGLRQEPNYSRMRRSFDGNEPFMTGSNVVAIRQVEDRKYETPDWFTDDKRVREFLLKQFPLMLNKCEGIGKCWANLDCKTCRQRKTAGKWAVVIKLWFVARMSDRDIEDAPEYQWKRRTVGSIVGHIRAVLEGKRQDTGKTPTGRPRGRPRKEIAGDSGLVQSVSTI
jgi:hypothetical protein